MSSNLNIFFTRIYVNTVCILIFYLCFYNLLKILGFLIPILIRFDLYILKTFMLASVISTLILILSKCQFCI